MSQTANAKKKPFRIAAERLSCLAVCAAPRLMACCDDVVDGLVSGCVSGLVREIANSVFVRQKAPQITMTLAPTLVRW